MHGQMNAKLRVLMSNSRKDMTTKKTKKEKKSKDDLSLFGLEPGTEEYKRIEAILIERICEVD
jgi:hypothetical protein